MEIGCGARVRDFDGRRYFYFWHYERSNGRSMRRENYVGRVDSEKARTDLLRRMAAYHRKAEQEFARRRARIEQLIASEHTSTLRYGPRGPRRPPEGLTRCTAALPPAGCAMRGLRDGPRSQRPRRTQPRRSTRGSATAR